MLPAPLSTTWARRRCARSSALSRRCDCTSEVLRPSRRAASAGCGVRIVAALRFSTRSWRSVSLKAIALSASASSTSGLLAAMSVGSTVRSNIDTEVAEGDWPAPGPATMTSQPLIASSMDPSMSSGCATSTLGASEARSPVRTLPAPHSSAERAARSAAPIMPRLPPITATDPKSPLCELRARGSSHGAAVSGVSRKPRASRSDSSPAPRSSSSSAPRQSRPSAVCSPTLCARNVRVWVARTAVPRMTPLSLSSPLGMSIARIGAPHAFMRSISWANWSSTSRASPSPSSPSTTSAGRRPCGHSRTMSAPRASIAFFAAFASGALGAVPDTSSTTTRWKPSPRCAAATHASPPLFPGPATTRMGAPVSVASLRAACAVACPARSMSEVPPDCAALFSTARN